MVDPARADGEAWRSAAKIGPISRRCACDNRDGTPHQALEIARGIPSNSYTGKSPAPYGTRLLALEIATPYPRRQPPEWPKMPLGSPHSRCFCIYVLAHGHAYATRNLRAETASWIISSIIPPPDGIAPGLTLALMTGPPIALTLAHLAHLRQKHERILATDPTSINMLG